MAFRLYGPTGDVDHQIDFLSTKMSEDNNRKSSRQAAKAAKLAERDVRAGNGDGGMKLGATTKDIAVASFEEEQAEQRSLESGIAGLGEVLRSKNSSHAAAFRMLEYCTTYEDVEGVEDQKQALKTIREEIKSVEAMMLGLANKKRCRPQEMDHFLQVGGKALRASTTRTNNEVNELVVNEATEIATEM